MEIRASLRKSTAPTYADEFFSLLPRPRQNRPVFFRAEFRDELILSFGSEIPRYTIVFYGPIAEVARVRGGRCEEEL